MHNVIKAIHEISQLEGMKVVGRKHVELTLAAKGAGGRRALEQIGTKLKRYTHALQPYGEPNVREIYKGSATKPSYKVRLLDNGNIQIQEGQNKLIGRIALARAISYAQKLQKKRPKQ